MKTIVVLTNFSSNANYAARVAVKLASTLHANLLLANAYVTEPVLSYAETLPWSADVYTLQEQESEKGLKDLKEQLTSIIDKLPEGQRKPSVRTLAFGGGISSGLAEIEHHGHLEMIVMGAGTHNAFEHFMMGSETNTVIGKSKVPVLIVPEGAVQSGIKRIFYATNFDPSDKIAIGYLAAFAAAFDANVEVVHVGLYGENQQDNHAAQVSLLEDIAQLKNQAISYKGVKGKNLQQRLATLCEEEKPDMFAMLHHQRSFLEGLFKQSETRKALANLALPLLIFPSSMKV
ncbi:universal stress protein [Mucilaginibacter sp. RS28]|uniref:Universal stress protein n=1 Tax=Mucilaginibacter straminoryzae TaxID=2932774 RepID=A0A9X2BCR5_9SPHI|nr:universal stress protein [Mucilaginibacter straminoryzae]MCJ8209568.1 universal stress protein [Mucilaginibacter straminoryzae]